MTQIAPDTVTMLVCYDTPAAGRHFKTLLDRLTCHFGAAVRFDVRLWRSDWLASGEIAALAASDARESPLLAISYTRDEPPSANTMELVELWASSWESREAALVALQASDFRNGALLGALQHCATRHRLTLLVSGDEDPTATGNAGRSAHIDPGAAGDRPAESLRPPGLANGDRLANLYPPKLGAQSCST